MAYKQNLMFFGGDLYGLVVVDFEFNNEAERDVFEMPYFCLVDITQEDFIAGGMIAGKTYQDIAPELDRFNYKRLDFNLVTKKYDSTNLIVSRSD